MYIAPVTVEIIIASFLGPLIVGLVLWFLGKYQIKKNHQSEAIRDLMTFRGDYVSQDFRRALNKVSITFHKDDEIRKDVRDLYEAVNNPSLPAESTNRKIVGLIYKLCQKNKFKGLTEYDIDQAFAESKQSPEASSFGDNVSLIESPEKEMGNIAKEQTESLTEEIKGEVFEDKKENLS